MGWLANVWLIIGVWLIGNRWRHAFLLTLVGNSLWLFVAVTTFQLDLAFISIVFIGLDIRNWRAWRR